VGIVRENTQGAYCSINTISSGLTLPTLHGDGTISLHLDRLDLVGARYYVNVGAYEREWAYAYDYHWQVYPLIVRATPGEKGILRPPHSWQIESTSGQHKSGRPVEVPLRIEQT
jgi:lipopolysaccharide transport system ATP-binding protein